MLLSLFLHLSTFTILLSFGNIDKLHSLIMILADDILDLVQANPKILTPMINLVDAPICERLM